MSDEHWSPYKSRNPKSKQTLKGYFRLASFDDVLSALMRGPADVVRYGRMTMSGAFYCVLHDSRADQSYGGVALTEDEFRRLRAICEGPITFTHTTGVATIEDWRVP